MNSKSAAVIIPAYNEEEFIFHTLQALTVNNNLEIIVVDNGSTDSTKEIARQQGAKVIDFPVGTIAAVRNRGVQDATADVLVFIDADVTVTQQWHEKFSRVLEQFRQNPLLVTGSRCQPTNSRSLLNKYWYAELTQYDASYINSGHLITSRELFNKIHGFSETLETAEDYDFCQKAVRDGAVISNNPELVVTHNGYPQTIAGFIQRERWHGVQDFESWRSFIQSKIAWFAFLNLGLFVAAIIICFTGSCIAIPVYFIIMYAISLLLTIYKFGIKRIDYMLMMPLMFYLYLCGRSLALVDRLLGIKK